MAARKSNGAKYEMSNMTDAEIRSQLRKFDAQIVEGKPKELSAEVRKQNGILRRHITNGLIVMSTRRFDIARAQASAELGRSTNHDEHVAWHNRTMEIANELREAAPVWYEEQD